MNRPPINSSGWSGFNQDDADRRLIWPNAWQFTREECVRLIALRGQVQRGQVSEDTAVTKRLRFVRLMWWRGMYGR